MSRMVKVNWSWIGFLLAAPLAMLLFVGMPDSQAQESKGDSPAANKEAAAKERKKPRGRLPNYYTKVVNEEQREQIYGIQAKYAEKIEAIEKQLQALRQQMNEEIESVLTPSQKTALEALKGAAEAERRKKAAEREKRKKTETSASDG